MEINYEIRDNYDFKLGLLYYRILSTEPYTVEVASTEIKSKIEIPYEVEHNGIKYYVISIGDLALSDNSILEIIEIPDSVKNIGKLAFSSSWYFDNIQIPDSVTSIGLGAFEGCDDVESIKLPNSLESIEANLFYNCGCLKNLVIPKSVKKIGRLAFCGCESLKSIVIPNSVSCIDSYAFRGSGISVIEIANSVSNIGEDIFEDTFDLEAILVRSDNPYLVNENGEKFLRFPDGKEFRDNRIVDYDFDLFNLVLRTR